MIKLRAVNKVSLRHLGPKLKLFKNSIFILLYNLRGDFKLWTQLLTEYFKTRMDEVNIAFDKNHIEEYD